MEKDQYTDDEFNLFYFTLKNKFKNVKIDHTLYTENTQTYSEIIDLKIDFYFEIIFGKRYNSNLYDYYNSLYFEVKDVEERNNKIISKIVNNFHRSFSYFFDEIAESRFVYFFKSSFLEKNIGFQKGDEKFNFFLVILILKNMRFENQDFTLINNSYATIINNFIDVSISNVRGEIQKNEVTIDINEISKDINALEIKKVATEYESLEKSIKSLRILLDDVTLYNKTFKPINAEIIKIPIELVKIKKIEIKFSPFKFRGLLTEFFKNSGVKIDSEKKNRIDRFILNVIDFDTDKYNTFTGSPSEKTINFFAKKEATILKFCALFLVLMKEEKMVGIADISLQEILRTELQEINTSAIGISEFLRNKISKDLNGLSNEKLAKFAGFNNTQEILGFVSV